MLQKHESLQKIEIFACSFTNPLSASITYAPNASIKISCFNNFEYVGYSETADHLIIGCDLFGSVWYSICRWIGIPCVFPGYVTGHYFQFIHMAGIPRSSLFYLKVIWLACSWAIWKERNNYVFKHAVIDPYSIVERVKLNSFLWLSSNVVPLAFGFHDWWRHPLLYMGVM